MNPVRGALAGCVTRANALTPVITRHIIQARHGGQTNVARQAQLNAAIARTRELLDLLETTRAELGWGDSDGAAA